MNTDKIALRKTFGQFATGVTVITCNRGGTVHGMTANSFTSVSLDPPLVLVSIDNRARMAQMLTEGSRYGLNILSAGQQALSNHFAGRPGAQDIPFIYHEDIPLIEGALAHLACEIRHIFPAGDHSLFVGEVLYHNHDEAAEQPLLFYGGGYRQLLRKVA